ncbi:MAG: DUF4827 domain-containing protein [Bacteroides sp.]|nr:DUF4827 domain-containing protein [Bacteroides sp.]
MKQLRYFLLLVLPFFITACSEDNEPDYGVFHLTIGTTSDVDVAMGTHSAEVTINGYAYKIDVGVVGENDSFVISDGYPDWMTVTQYRDKHFYIDVAELSSSESRTGVVNFVVFRGNKSETGYISITQNPLTYEDLQKTEQRAIKSYLKKFDVYDELPPLNEIQVGSVAPFYKLDSDGYVYMQVVKMGSAPAATQGETIYFRFLRYNLLSYFENGVLPNGEGNMNSIDQSVTSFVVGSNQASTTQWGTAIQMPMLLGLPSDSEVNLVVASQAGFTSEIANVIPYLYNIRYYQTKY